jgi:heme A synthase
VFPYHGSVPARLAADATASPGFPGLRSVARRWADLILAPTPVTMRRLALAGVAAAALIIATGAAVRLSQSGLGCPDWPDCTSRSIVASGATGGQLIHRWVEFGNRLVTVAIMIIAALVLIAAWRFRPEGTRRLDLVWLAALQPAGIMAQAVLGGIVVLTRLDPVWVSVHFLLSMALVAAAVALHVRVTEGRAWLAGARPVAGRELRLICSGVLALLMLMFAAGTVVTGTGPLAGARSVPRYHLPLAGVTQFHADIGWLIAGLVLALATGLQLTSAPRRAVRLGWLLAALIGAQGAIGYTQYFMGLPAGLVWFHVVGSVAVWIAALRLAFSLHDRGSVDGCQDAAATRPDAARI